MHYQVGETGLRRRRSKEAIALAMQGRWEEAVTANSSIVEVFPQDINAYNRLGKAFTELGRYAEAKEAYMRALDIDPKNNIARKNMRRLSLLHEAQPALAGRPHQVSPQLFIEETGKAGVARLEQLAPREVLAKMAAGELVYLRLKGRGIIAENKLGEYLGHVEPRIGARLTKLIKGGNRYTAAITSSTDGEVKIIITEIFQHPSQAGRPSFPAKRYDGFRSYVKDSVLKYELDEEEGLEDIDYHLEWEEELEPLPEGISLLTSDTDDDIPAEE